MSAKPIVVIYFPDTFVGGRDRNWIYEYMAALNGETDGMSKWKLKTDYTDYHWFCFYKYDISEPELKVFYEKDFTQIQYEELKQMILDSINQQEICHKCHGEGTVPGKTGGSEGIPEADVMFVCNECGGSGKIKTQ